MRHLALLILALSLVGGPARAQMDSREGIALQNQILQLRQELDQLRQSGGGGGRGGYGGGSLPPPSPRGGPAVGAGQSELVAGLLERVGSLEEETRRLRGRVEEADYQNGQLRQQLEKMQGDIDYRLQQVEGGRAPGAAAPAPVPAPAPGRAPAPAAPPAPAGSPPAAAPRPPERALSDGNAALQRRDYAAA
jgi:hypothetical protein